MHMFKDKSVLLALGVGVVAGAIIFYAGGKFLDGDSEERMMAEYYKIENLVSVSPYEIKTALLKGEHNKHVVVDMRSPAEYEAGHVTGAINIPQYLPSDATGQNSEGRIVEAFRQVVVDNPGKDIVAYCYSAACMATRKAGNMLADHGVYIKHLNIGWYEWKYYWTMWNGEDGNIAEDFITVGNEPGEPTLSGEVEPCGEGEFGC
ncbi:MAG: rhodanese-like domain-containing protein [Candidatus Paceibacterota bacterium]